MSENELVSIAMKWAAENDVPISVMRAKKIARAVARRIRREEQRLGGCSVTTDDFRPTTYSDRTGEAAVRNVLAELFGTPA